MLWSPYSSGCLTPVKGRRVDVLDLASSVVVRLSRKATSGDVSESKTLRLYLEGTDEAPTTWFIARESVPWWV